MALAELPDRRHGLRSTRSGRKRVVLAFFALLMVGGLAWAWLVRSLAPGADHRQSDSKSGVDPSYSLYVGERVCSECHPGEAALHRRSGHAKTLRSVAQIGWERQFDGAVTEDPERPGVFWKFTKQDGQYWTERTAAGEVERFVIDYAFGSGRHAITDEWLASLSTGLRSWCARPACPKCDAHPIGCAIDGGVALSDAPAGVLSSKENPINRVQSRS